LEQIAATARSNAESSARANVLAADTTSRAERGQNVVRETAAAMNRIKDSASKISEIISEIDGIAFQTNLLALNAAVEAARAGDAGKGFAVVAAEVRTLAQRSSQAAKDITCLIGDSANHVTAGVRLTETAGDALNEIVEGLVDVANTIDGISAASREQSVGIGEISQTVSHLDSMTQQNAALSDQSAATARRLSGQAGELADIVGVFRTESAAASRDGALNLAKSAKAGTAREISSPIGRPGDKTVRSRARRVVGAHGAVIGS
jgi:methyl-accepting chemotaxis protein